MAEVVTEAVPAHEEDLEKRVPIPLRSCSTQVTSPQITLSGVKAATTRQQCIGSETVPECVAGLKRESTETAFLAPRPSWAMPLNSSPHIDIQDPKNHPKRLLELSTTSYSCPSGTDPSTAATPECTPTSLRQRSKAFARHARGNGKRGRRRDDSESEDVSEPPEKSSKKKICDTPGSMPRLACPFFMCRPHTHLRCGFSSFGRISHVAQHLERQHYERVRCDCPICGINFDTLSDRNAHLREQRCPRRNPRLCAVTTERLEEIKSVSTNRLKAQGEKWVDIYKIIVGDSTPAPQSSCSNPLEYLLRHFISFASRSGDHGIVDAGEDPEAESQTLRNYLVDEQEPHELSSLQLSLPDSNFPELSVQGSMSSIPDTPITSLQLHRATIPTPVSPVQRSHEANMTNLDVMSNQFHGLGYNIISLEDLEGFFNFPGHDEGSLT